MEKRYNLDIPTHSKAPEFLALIPCAQDKDSKEN